MKQFTFFFLTFLFSIYLYATECDSLTLTIGTYSETEDLIAAIQAEFGDDYTIGDWTDLEAVSDIDDWISCMNFSEDQTFMLTRNGEYFYNGNRQYYVHYSSDGIPYPNFLVHDQIGDLYLGSWYGLDYNILAKHEIQTFIEFITEFHDLNDNNVPEGWELYVNNAPVSIENGHLLATPTDARGCLMRSGVVPENATKMTFEWDGNLAYASWGMQNQLQLDFNQNEWLYVSIITSEYNFGGMNKVRITYFDGNQQTKVFEESIEKDWSDFHYKVEISGDDLILRSTYISNSNLYYEKTFDIVELIPTYSFEVINKIRFWVYTTTDNNNWLDNISVEINGTTDINSIVNEDLVTLYPNPASHYVFINSFEQITQYEIFDIKGQKTIEKQVLNNGSIDISDLANGIYFLKYVGQNRRIMGTVKFIKN